MPSKAGDLKRILREARDLVAQGQREVLNRGWQPPEPLQRAHDKLGEAVDLVRDALADAAKTGQSD